MPVIVTTLVALGVHAATLLVRRKRVGTQATAGEHLKPAPAPAAGSQPRDGDRERSAA